jgi:hypothetical protein
VVVGANHHIRTREDVFFLCSADPDVPPDNFQPPFTEQFYGFGVTLVLVVQDPFCKGILVIVF